MLHLLTPHLHFFFLQPTVNPPYQETTLISLYPVIPLLLCPSVNIQFFLTFPMSHEIKRLLLLRRKFMTNLDSILKSRDIILPTKVCLVKVFVFPVVMYECESWTVKKAEHWRIDAFELWCWRRLLRVPWTARRSSQSILKEISPGYSLEELMLKLKLQYFGHLMQRADSLEKTQCWERLKAKGEESGRGWDILIASLTAWTWI